MRKPRSVKPSRFAATTGCSRHLPIVGVPFRPPTDRARARPAGAPDLNPPGLTAEAGVLFMEGEGEPTEIKQLRRDLETLAGDMEAVGVAIRRDGEGLGGRLPLAAYPQLADLWVSAIASSRTTGRPKWTRRR